MHAQPYLVIQSHTSEYPAPITFRQGDTLVVGERYEGDEGWNDWLLCSMADQQDGWVPAQILEPMADGRAMAREDYTARELNVREGERLLCSRTLNGWGWCARADGGESGWVPLGNLIATPGPKPD